MGYRTRLLRKPHRAARLGVLALALAAAGFVSSLVARAENEVARTKGPSVDSDLDRDHWAFQKRARPAVPAVNERGRVRTPIDAFILAKLEARGLGFSPDAGKSTLIRRLFLDLLGLPPMPDEVAGFLQDARPDAYEQLVDRLLSSPHFGERWGRHWLDGAGHTDILGCDNDAARIKFMENKWRYRDYVIHALNTDKPFDRFLTEQIAGDELVDWRSAKTFDEPTRELLIATGFLRVSADDTDENELNTPDIRHGVLQRTGEILVSNLLGLTFNCAKCHDHKYESIPQRDYYRFLALLQPAFNPQAWLQPKDRELPDVAPAEKVAIERRNKEIDREIGELTKTLAVLRQPYQAKLAATRLANVPEPIRADVQTAIRTPADKRDGVFKYLASKFEKFLEIKPEDVTAALNDKDRVAATKAEQQIADLKTQRRSWSHLQVVYDTGPPTPTFLLRRGNHLNPGAEVEPGFLSVLSESDATSACSATKPPGATSGRRLALARWLTDVESPAGSLVLRVRVNRVWQHLFGSGIVETADNFGVTGVEPTHPELLEWLASEFSAGGQRLKPLIRLLVTSSVYRQASAEGGDRCGPDPRTVDPDDRLLWRMRLRRLESEAVRDRILSVSGALDCTVGGAPIPVDPRPDGTFVIPEKGLPTPTSQWRRTVYLLARRNYHPNLLDAFDQPNVATNCSRRSSSSVVLQSLTMLNDQFVLEQADRLADRVVKSACSSGGAQPVQAAFALILARPPSPSELALCAELLDRHQKHYGEEKVPSEKASRKAVRDLCHTLLNTSEFLYTP